MRTRVVLFVVALTVGAVVPAGAEPAVDAGSQSFAQAPVVAEVVDPLPAPWAVVLAGEAMIDALVVGVAPGAVATVTVNGVAVPTTVVAEAAGLRVTAPATLAHGGNSITVQAIAPDGAVVERTWSVDGSAVTAERVAGGDRVETAIAIAQQLLPLDQAAQHVFLARADGFADALAATPAAAALGGPVLLTWTDSLHPLAAQELQRVLKAGGTVHLLGGVAALAEKVAEDVSALGFAVQRHAGADRYATAAELAALVPGGGTTLGAVVARGDLEWPALEGAVVAAVHGAPLLLTPPDALPDSTRNALLGAGPTLLLGPMDDAVVAQVADLTDATPTTIDTDQPAALASAVLPWLEPGSAAALTAQAPIADALAAGPLAAQLRAPLVPVAAGTLTEDARDAVAAGAPDLLLAFGGTNAVPDAVVADAAVARLDGPHAPGAVPDPAAGATLAELAFAVAADQPLTGAGFGVRLGGREVPGTTTLDGATARWEAGRIPSDVPRDVPLAVEVTGIVVAGNHARHVGLAYVHTVTVDDVAGPDGFVIAGGGSDVVGTGTLRRFTIEVEPGTGWEPQDFAAIAEPWLLDTARGWPARGQWALQRVDDAAQANIRVVLASPATVDRFCNAVGLDTEGEVSCWDGRRAMINLDRWNTAVPHFSDVPVYRGYVLNHEFGHGLGYHHVDCPSTGALAPVMLQQTYFLHGCVANPYPYP